MKTIEQKEEPVGSYVRYEMGFMVYEHDPGGEHDMAAGLFDIPSDPPFTKPNRGLPYQIFIQNRNGDWTHNHVDQLVREAVARLLLDRPRNVWYFVRFGIKRWKNRQPVVHPAARNPRRSPPRVPRVGAAAKGRKHEGKGSK